MGPQILTEEEMESKAREFGLDDILKRCKSKSVDRDPDVRTVPPHTSIKHTRERGLIHSDPSSDFCGLIFHWIGPDGEPRRSIRNMHYKGLDYRLPSRMLKNPVSSLSLNVESMAYRQVLEVWRPFSAAC
jgi:hypothetical protein